MRKFLTSKKISVLLIVFALLFLLSLTSYAKGPSVVDSANLFSETEKTSLEEKIKETIELTGVDIVIVTTKSTDGKTSEAYSDDYFDYNGYGLGPQRNGMLLLINMKDREMHISLRGSGTDFFTDAKVENALDYMTPHASSEAYAKAAETFLEYVQKCYSISMNSGSGIYESPTEYYHDSDISGGIHGSIDTPEKPEKETEPPNPASVILIAIIAGSAVGAIACAIVFSKYKMKIGGYKYPFQQKSSLHLTTTTDVLVDRHITQQRINNDNNRSSGGGSSSSGSSTRHTSSSGASHRGSTRGF